MFSRRRHRRVIERDLARLADGSLKPRRRERVERTIEGSYELQARLTDQRRAVAAIRALASDRAAGAPLALRLRQRALGGGSHTRSAAFGLGLSGVLAALVLMLGSVVPGGGQGVLTIAEAATIAARPATTVVAEPPDSAATLPRVSAAGLPFPYWEDRFGWVATGVRSDEVGGRALTTVHYRRDGREIAYTIVPGSSLPAVAGARTTGRGGVVIHSSVEGGRRVVTWERRGHTCVLSGTGVPLAALVKLAAWRGHGRIPY